MTVSPNLKRIPQKRHMLKKRLQLRNPQKDDKKENEEK